MIVQTIQPYIYLRNKNCIVNTTHKSATNSKPTFVDQSNLELTLFDECFFSYQKDTNKIGDALQKKIVVIKLK